MTSTPHSASAFSFALSQSNSLSHSVRVSTATQRRRGALRPQKPQGAFVLFAVIIICVIVTVAAKQSAKGREKMHENNNRNNYTNNSIAVDAAVAAGSTHATQLTLNWQQNILLSLTPCMCAIMQIKHFVYMYACKHLCVCVQNFNPNIL